jgi:hypothetical protein
MSSIHSRDARAAEFEELGNDAAAAILRAILVWNKVHDPRRAALSAGEHAVAVVIAAGEAVGEAAGQLAAMNPNAHARWLRKQIARSFLKAFDQAADPVKGSA